MEGDAWDQLAAGIIAGHHRVRCTMLGGNCSSTGRNIPNLADVGYPIVEGRADGTFTVTKHPNTGGLVIGGVGSRNSSCTRWADPHSLHHADVIADFYEHQARAGRKGSRRVHGIAARADRQAKCRSVSRWMEASAVSCTVADALEKAHSPTVYSAIVSGIRSRVRSGAHGVRRCKCEPTGRSRATRAQRARSGRCASVCAAPTRRSRTVYLRADSARAEWAAECRRALPRPSESGRDRRLLARARRLNGRVAALEIRNESASCSTRHARSGDKGDTANVGLSRSSPSGTPSSARS